jgi:dienelactone hydrolase
MRVSVPLLLLALLLATPARAQLRDVWPDPATLDGAYTEQTVAFASSSPFVPDDFRRGSHDARDAGPPVSTVAMLYMPKAAAPNHGTPAVILLHGAAGMVAERGATYGPQLASMGVAVLVVDTYGSRRDMARGFIGRVIHITETMFVTDAYAGLIYLAQQPQIDARHIVLAGFSYGGMATVFALYEQMAEHLAPPGLRFAGHVDFYGPCIARFDNPRTTGAPLLMLNGAEDRITPIQQCRRIEDDVRRGGSAVNLIQYAGAVHQWDGGMSRRMIGRNLSGCAFRVEADGTTRDAHTMLPMTGWFDRAVSLGLCTAGAGPYPIGADPVVRAESNRDFAQFLRQVFAE